MAKQAFEGYKQNAVSYVLMMLINVVVAAGPLLVIVIAFAVLSIAVNKSELGVVLVILGLFGIFASLWAAIVGSIGKLAIVQRVLDSSKGPILDSYKKVLNVGFLVQYIVASVLLGILVLVGFLCFVIPGIYMLVPAMLWPYVMVKERLSIIDSISRAFKLANGFWWATFFRVGVFALGMAVLDTALRIPFGLITHFVHVPAVVIGAAGLYGLLSGLLAVCVFAPLQLVLGRNIYLGIADAKAKDPNAKQLITGGDIGLIIGLVVASMIVWAVGAFANPFGGLMQFGNRNSYDYGDYDYNDMSNEEFDRIMNELENDYGNSYNDYGNYYDNSYDSYGNDYYGNSYDYYNN